MLQATKSHMPVVIDNAAYTVKRCEVIKTRTQFGEKGFIARCLYNP